MKTFVPSLLIKLVSEIWILIFVDIWWKTSSSASEQRCWQNSLLLINFPCIFYVFVKSRLSLSSLSLFQAGLDDFMSSWAEPGKNKSIPGS